VLSFLGLCFLLTASGCASLGAKALKGERTLPNTALQQTNDEQLLISLVRFRHGDTPAFKVGYSMPRMKMHYQEVI